MSISKDKVSVGDEFVIGFKQVEEGSPVYTESTLESVIPLNVNETDFIDSIINYVK